MEIEDQNRIVLTFVYTSYDFRCIGPSLVRYTADISENVLKLQILVLDDISDDELDLLYLIATYMIAQFGDLMLDEEFIKIEHAQDEAMIEPLPLGLFRLAV